MKVCLSVIGFFFQIPKMARIFFLIHWGSPTLTLLIVRYVLNVLDVLTTPKDAQGCLACPAGPCFFKNKETLKLETSEGRSLLKEYIKETFSCCFESKYYLQYLLLTIVAKALRGQWFPLSHQFH